MALHQAAATRNALRTFLKLNDGEIGMCKWVGEARFEYAVAHGLNPGLGTSKDVEEAKANSIRGVECEFAASVLLNVSWRPNIGILGQPDIGEIIEVRSIDRPDRRLIVKPDAKPNAPYVLILIENDVHHFAGWEFAKLAKKWPLEDYGRDRAHYVDRNRLRSMPELFGLIGELALTKCRSHVPPQNQSVAATF
jgi:hypothetical protein